MSEPSYHTIKHFLEKLPAIKMNQINVKMNKSVYLGPSILGISKIVIHEYWSDHVKPKYEKKAKICYMDTNSFIFQVRSEDIYADLAETLRIYFTHLTMKSKDHYQ